MVTCGCYARPVAAVTTSSAPLPAACCQQYSSASTPLALRRCPLGLAPVALRRRQGVHGRLLLRLRLTALWPWGACGAAGATRERTPSAETA